MYKNVQCVESYLSQLSKISFLVVQLLTIIPNNLSKSKDYFTQILHDLYGSQHHDAQNAYCNNNLFEKIVDASIKNDLNLARFPLQGS